MAGRAPQAAADPVVVEFEFEVRPAVDLEHIGPTAAPLQALIGAGAIDQPDVDQGAPTYHRLPTAAGRRNLTLADWPAGNLKILRRQMDIEGRPDLVDRGARLFARVVVPEGRVIAGFGRDGQVYAGVAENDGVRLERYRGP